MSATDHLAKARDYIAIAESQDSKREAYMKAADEIAAYQGETGESAARIAIRIDREARYVQLLLQWRASGYVAPSPFRMDDASNDRAAKSHAKKVLADPEQRRQVIASLPADQIEQVIETAHEVAVERVRARQAEQRTDPTAGDLMGSDPFDPSESWLDVHIIRVRSKAHALAHQAQKWGVVLGSMTDEEAFEALQETERNVAEVRVALQERIRDRRHADRTEV